MAALVAPNPCQKSNSRHSLKVKGDTSLQEKLKAAPDANAVTAIAKEAGFMISADDIKAQQSELSDEELESVAAGRDRVAATMAARTFLIALSFEVRCK